MLQVVGRMSIILVVVTATIGSLLVGGMVAVVEVFSPPHYIVTFGEIESVSAEAWIVFDVATGEVLASRNAEKELPIASITKLPVSYVIAQNEDIYATTTVTWSDLEAEGRAGKLEADDVYSFHTLLFPLLLESSNDASRIFARTHETLQEDLVKLATDLDLRQTRFVDASGLSSENISTVKDLARFTTALYTTYPHLLDITRLPEYRMEVNGWRNNNPFVAIPEYAGGKHGYTPYAHHTALSLFDELLAGGHVRPIGYIVLKSDDLLTDVAHLRTYTKENISYK